MWNHLRRAAGEIDRRDTGFSEPIKNPINRLAGHDFLSSWPRVHVTMNARQIAKLAHVHLKNFWTPTAERDRPLC